MSFRVESRSPFDDEWRERDGRIEDAAAGVPSCDSGAGFGCRDHGWVVGTFAEAVELKRRLETVPDVSVTIQEQMTDPA